MQLLRGLYNIASDFPGCVATIGNFDGVTLGHSHILARLQQVAAEHQLPSLVVVFEPQPREFFAPEQAPARLSSLSEKICLMKEQGIDYVLCLPFNQKLRSKTAEQFVDQVLVSGIAVKHLIVGDDFRFGCDRSGDFAFLQASGSEQGFVVEDTPTFELLGERVSSTSVRKQLAADQLVKAAELLGRDFSISGRVGYGRQLGRTINAPTANILLKRDHLMMKGVYAVEVQGVNGSEQVYYGAANLGVKPTVTNDQPEPSLEVHLLDFKGDLYGQRLTVTFKQKIRDEKKFDGFEQLKNAIAQDFAQAKEFFAKQ